MTRPTGAPAAAACPESPQPSAGVTVRPARREDDAAIRRLLRESPLPGDIRLAMPREPDFFASTAVEGRRVQVAVAESGGEVLGLVLRAEKEAYVNGSPTPVGYLGGWRIAAHPEGMAILRRGSRCVREWHEAGRARFYLLALVEGNRKPEALLRARRLGLPQPRDLGALRTHLLRPAPAARRLAGMLPVLRQQSLLLARKPVAGGGPTVPGAGPGSGPPLRIRRGAAADLPDVLRHLRRGASRQFFPVYGPEDFRPGGLLQGLHPEDLLLATREGALVGVLGLWDQNGYKQNVVAGYSARLSRLRPLVNAWNRLRARPLLPRPGSAVKHLSLAAVCIPGDDPFVYASLLQEALAAAGSREDVGHVAALVHERDPFAPLLARLPAHVYRSRLCLGRYTDGADGAGTFPDLDGRAPYVELGSL